ncbi:enoyl-CoA hydratase-related protein [Paraconexibacter algicola]|uniref:Enoyl-CoA hydratase n=1 Tax=Paraconexibacter algicola TaxID=2133960 RepID=A0A2T4UEW7_9ACTN|nr:enoyl-CoA hydratase-related protein [Paraconexibacter algicola]PTL56337.1 enoyl-CoA hydratase [Paraconexibacter algicola]
MSDYVLAQETPTVRTYRNGSALKIELNRPEALNAFNGALARELQQELTAAAQDDEIRAVMLTGAGRAFSSGADLMSFQDTEDPVPVTENGRPDLRKTLHDRYHPIIETLRSMPKPVVSAVNGPCVGVGLGIALAGDLVVAHESAYFLLAFVNIGLVPDGGSSLFVPARIGAARAAEMAMLGEKVPAAQALEWGLVNRVHDDASFMPEAERLLERLATGPTRSYAGTKRQLNAHAMHSLTAQLALEADIQQEMADTADFIEGGMSFAQKRPPAFSGR